jgi:type I restriction enzyme S subunit
MRAGWKIKTLGEVCEIYNGGTPSTNIPEYWDGGIQWITPKDMGRSKDMYVSHCERTISQEGVEHSSTKVLPERSVIVSSRAPIGYVAINEVPMATNQGCKGFVLGKEIYPEFLYYFLLSSTDLLNKLGTGATFKEVSGKKLAGIELPFPSIPEQQRIVDILDREFAKIDALKANAEKSLQAAKDLFQATLKKELEPKEGWKKITLKDIAIVRVGPFGSSLHKNDYISGGTPLVNPIHMKDGQVVPAVDFSVNQEKLNELRSYVLKEGDIVFARRGEIGRCALITDKEDGYLCGTGSLFVRFLRKTNSKFMIALFNSPFVKEQLLSKATGATMLNINSTSVENLELDMPTDKEQESILSCIDDLNKRCNTLQENYQKTLTLCDDLKQSLLRKAFNGEL